MLQPLYGERIKEAVAVVRERDGSKPTQVEARGLDNRVGGGATRRDGSRGERIRFGVAEARNQMLLCKHRV